MDSFVYEFAYIKLKAILEKKSEKRWREELQ